MELATAVAARFDRALATAHRTGFARKPTGVPLALRAGARTGNLQQLRVLMGPAKRAPTTLWTHVERRFSKGKPLAVELTALPLC